MSSGQAGNDAASESTYRFADVVVDLRAHTILRGGTPVNVEPKAYAVLVELLRHSGELLQRDTLLDRIWGHQHVTPGVLTRAIAQLRQALGDDSQHPRFIQTRHALGYRFIGELIREGHPDARHRKADANQQEQPAAIPSAPVALKSTAVSPSVIPAVEPAAAGALLRASDPPKPPSDLALSPTVSLDLPRAHSPPRPRFRRWVMAMAGFGALALIGILLWQRHGRIAEAKASEASVAVMPFASLGDDRRDQYFADGLSVEMHDALSGVRGLKVAARTSLTDTPGQKLSLQQLGKTLGVAAVLQVSVRRQGQRVHVGAKLADTGTGFTLWSDNYDRELSDVFAVQTEIASQVTEKLLGAPRDQGNLRKRLAPTHNIAAFDDYLKGVSAMQGPNDEADLDQSVRNFNSALAIDPQFARAQAGICRVAIVRLDTFNNAKAYSAAEQACARARKMDPTLNEVNLLLGDLARVQNNDADAINYYNAAMRDPALRTEAYIGLAKIPSINKRPNLALEYYRRALALRPGDDRIYREIGYHYYLAGNIKKAVENFSVAASLNPDDSGLWSSLGGLYLVSGDRTKAENAFTRSLAIKPNSAALSNLGTLKYEMGQYRQAANLYRRATLITPEDYRLWGNLGDALRADPASTSQAVEAYKKAESLSENYVLVSASDALAHARLAWYKANTGKQKSVMELIQRAQKLETESTEVLWWSSLAAMRIGKQKEALVYLNKARVAGVSEERIRAEPQLRKIVSGNENDKLGNPMHPGGEVR